MYIYVLLFFLLIPASSKLYFLNFKCGIHTTQLLQFIYFEYYVLQRRYFIFSVGDLRTHILVYLMTRPVL